MDNISLIGLLALLTPAASMVALVWYLGREERRINRAAHALIKADLAVLKARNAHDDYVTDTYLALTQR